MVDGVKVGTAYLEIVASARGAVAQVQKDFGQGMPDVGKKAGASLGGGVLGAAKKFAGPIAGLFAVDAAKDFLSDAIGQASDMNETVSKSKAIFGEQSGAIDSWANNAAKQFGLTKNEALDAASGFGDMFRQIGFSGDDAAKSSESIVQMATDLGSFNNLGTDEVLDKISGAMRGEYDSLQSIIPNISAARVEQEALNSGLVKGTVDTKKLSDARLRQDLAQKKYNETVAKYGKDSDQAKRAQLALNSANNAAEKASKAASGDITAKAKAQAVMNIIQKDGSRAVGDFAKTSGGLANQQKILSAQVNTLKQRLGTALLPVVLKVTSAVTGFVGGMQDGTGKGGQFVAFLRSAGGVLQSVGGFIARNRDVLIPLVGALATGVLVFKAITSAVRIFTAVQAALNLVMSLNPIGLVVIAIAALVTGLVLAYKHSATFRNVVNAAFAAVKKAAVVVFGFLRTAVVAVIGFITKNWRTVASIFTTPVRLAWLGIKLYITAVRTVLGAIASFVTGTFKTTWAGLKQIFTHPVETAKAAISTLLGKSGLQKVFSSAVTAVGKIWDGLKALAKKPISFIINTVLNDGLIKAFNTIADVVGAKNIGRLNIPGFAGGGWTGPGSKFQAAGVVHADEYVFTKEDVKRAGGPGFFDSWRAAIHRKGVPKAGDVGLPGYATGGFVKALGYAKKNEGHPYVFGSIWDCSGFMSSLQSIINGGGPRRLWSTPAFAGGPTHAQGYTRNQKSAFMIGVDPRSGKFGHTAGTLLGHRVEESGGVGLRVDGGARGYNDGYFPLRYGLDKGAGLSGKVDAFFQSGFDSVKGWFSSLVDGPLGKLREITGTPFGQVASRVPHLIAEGMKDSIPGFATGGTLAPGWSRVGERGSELVFSPGGGQQVLNRQQAKGLGGANVSGNTFYAYTPEDVIEEARRAQRQHEALHPIF